MPTLLDLENHFSEFEYPRNEQGFTDIPMADIYAALRDAFPLGYEWRPFAVGYNPEGATYFVGTLTVRAQNSDGSLFSHTCTGAATSHFNIIDFAGLSSMALRNATLRGLGMGAAIYDSAKPEEVAPSAVISDTPAAVSPNPSPPRFNPRPSYQNNNYQQNARRSGGDYPEWTGSVKVKSGEFAGKEYRTLPDDTIEQWATSGIETAIKELNRRRASTPAGRILANSAFRR